MINYYNFLIALTIFFYSFFVKYLINVNVYLAHLNFTLNVNFMDATKREHYNKIITVALTCEKKNIFFLQES